MTGTGFLLLPIHKFSMRSLNRPMEFQSVSVAAKKSCPSIISQQRFFITDNLVVL